MKKSDRIMNASEKQVESFHSHGMIRKITVAAIMLLTLFCTGSDIQAQQADKSALKFDHVFDLGSPGGQTMLQDNDGFLWIGTEGGGIFRYDGYDLKNYGAGPGLLSNGHVWRILEDSQNPNVFWIGTSGGLNRFDKETETFTYFEHSPDDSQSLGDNTVSQCD